MLNKYKIVDVLMKRDGLTREDAEEEKRIAFERVFIDGEDPEEVLLDLGLEPDYYEDLIL